MHSAICRARTAAPGAGVKRAVSSLTHESSQNLRWISSSSDSGSEKFRPRGAHAFEKPADGATRSVRTSSAAVDSYGAGMGLHAAGTPAASSPVTALPTRYMRIRKRTA